jgi:ubiquinol-cytochrome c reductase subunit 7
MNLGLHHDDILYENDAVKEALRRLPQNLQDDRNFRITRALHLSMTKTILPKDQWTKYEEGKCLNENINNKSNVVLL